MERKCLACGASYPSDQALCPGCGIPAGGTAMAGLQPNPVKYDDFQIGKGFSTVLSLVCMGVIIAIIVAVFVIRGGGGSSAFVHTWVGEMGSAMIINSDGTITGPGRPERVTWKQTGPRTITIYPGNESPAPAKLSEDGMGLAVSGPEGNVIFRRQ